MGRIKIRMIKRITTEALEKDRNSYTTDFSKNKGIIARKINVPSKKVRNVIAGYIARVMKRKVE
ncbi:MAG: 30S ribosomal protein S17e [Candidatus Woesearchaeota archaeon]|nr:30S ribosomal protein S17e [Candidatus Woesearchaeota archaeon]